MFSENSITQYRLLPWLRVTCFSASLCTPLVHSSSSEIARWLHHAPSRLVKGAKSAPVRVVTPKFLYNHARPEPFDMPTVHPESFDKAQDWPVEACGELVEPERLAYSGQACRGADDLGPLALLRAGFDILSVSKDQPERITCQALSMSRH
jgi:hypothetical protein